VSRERRIDSVVRKTVLISDCTVENEFFDSHITMIVLHLMGSAVDGYYYYFYYYYYY